MKCYIILTKADKRLSKISLETALSAYLFHLSRTTGSENVELIPEAYKDVVQFDVIPHDNSSQSLAALQTAVHRCLVFDNESEDSHTFVIAYLDITPCMEDEIMFLSALGESSSRFVIHIFDNKRIGFTDFLEKNQHIAVHYSPDCIPAFQIAEFLDHLSADHISLLSIAQFSHYHNSNMEISDSKGIDETIIQISENYDVWEHEDRKRIYGNDLLRFYLIDYINNYVSESKIWQNVFDNFCAENVFAGARTILALILGIVHGEDELFLSKESLSKFISQQDKLIASLRDDVLTSIRIGSRCAGVFTGILLINLDPYEFGSSIRPEMDKRMVERRAKFTAFYKTHSSDIRIVVRRLDEGDDCRHVVWAVLELAGVSEDGEGAATLCGGKPWDAWCILTSRQWEQVKLLLRVSNRLPVEDSPVQKNSKASLQVNEEIIINNENLI